MNRLNLIKTLVGILSFLLIFGMLSTLGIIFQKTRAKSAPVSQISLNEPKGSQLVSFQTANNLIYLFVKGGKKADRLIIVNQDIPTIQTTISIE